MIASSGNIVGLDFKTKATLLHHMLHGPTIQVKDIFKFALSGAVCTPKLQLMSETAWKIWKTLFDDALKNTRILTFVFQSTTALYPKFRIIYAKRLCAHLFKKFP